MQDLLGAVVDELRSMGVPVSIGEHLDAARALSAVSLQDKELVRATLQCALIKRAEHVAAFNLVFELYTAGRRAEDGGLLAELSDDELAALLRAVIASDEHALRRQVADEYVRRFGGLAPGDAVAGVFATIAVTEAADLEALRAGLAAAGGEGDGGGGGGGTTGWSRSALLQDRLDRADADRAVDRFQAELQSAVRRALVADRGARAVRATMRAGLAEHADIGTASAAEREEMAAAIAPIARQLTKVLARKSLHRKRRLSIRRTVRRAMGTGGVPFRLVTDPAPPPRPDLVVLADMSGSVATFSKFTLDLLVALDSRLSRLRVFSFVDGLAEITGLVRDARSAGAQLLPADAARDAIRLGGSDYGYVLRDFAAQYAHQLSARSVLLVVGDARTNYLDPAESSFAQIRRRVGQVYWLNPERRRYWDQGDSVMSRYAPYCDQVQECRTLRQIADFVQSLAA